MYVGPLGNVALSMPRVTPYATSFDVIGVPSSNFRPGLSL